jgi:D-alanine--poly(phosphoribitol) ligase subunit 1
MVLDKIAESVEKYPLRTVYKVGDKSITYRELWKKANVKAEQLREEGKAPVIIYDTKKIETFTTIVACLLAGCPYVPINRTTPPERVEEITKAIQTSDIAEDTAYIIFTSGSTGKPKGVPISTENLDNFTQWISGLRPLSEYAGCNVLNQANFSFDLSVADMYYSLCNSHSLIEMDLDVTEEYSGIVPLFSREKINVAMLTPTFIRLCLLDESFCAEKCPELKCIYSCGELLDKKTARKLLVRFPCLKLINAYGPTEATSAVSGIVITETMLKDDRPLPVGDMRTNAVDIVIDDGEIILKGKSVSPGYLGDIDGGFFSENGLQCYRTGDLGYILDGMLYCTGRKDSQVKYNGYRIELMDIENNIISIPGVQECAVIAKYTESNTVKTIKAFVNAEAKDLNPAIIRNELSKKIPGYMIPRTIEILDRLPVNQNGKIDRKALAEL